MKKSKNLKINIITKFNGLGLENDFNILKAALEKLGHTIHGIDFESKKKVKADLNIIIEYIVEEMLSWAPVNWFLPNPEWYVNEIEDLKKPDLILCRTREVERICKTFDLKTYFLGFTSKDCYEASARKNFYKLLHIAGGSRTKGTQYVLDAWKNNPNLPHLTVITKYEWDFPQPQKNLKIYSGRMPEDELSKLKNSCGIHLCPSQSEGFGHYIVEAMSTGAIVLTTDAPPMNEFISDPYCLIPVKAYGKERLATIYAIDENALRHQVEFLSTLPKKELKEMGKENRQNYFSMQNAFLARLKALFDEQER